MKKRQWILGLAVLLGLVIVSLGAPPLPVQLLRGRLAVCPGQLEPNPVAFGCIFLGYFFRAARWAALMRHNKKVSGFSLVGPQIIGFTAVGLIGRVADLVRPYLIARKTQTEVSAQIAVYVVERLSDMGSIALVFSLAILSVTPNEITKAIGSSHWLSLLSSRLSPQIAAFFFRYGGLFLTLLGVLFLVGIRLGGDMIARIFETAFGFVSQNLARAAGHKIRTFHAGLDTIRSFADFSVLVVLSLSMWALIAAPITNPCALSRPARTSPPPRHPRPCFLMVASGAASVFQTAGTGMVLADRHRRRGHLRLLWRRP